MLVSMTIKVQPEFKEEFTRIAESLGMPAGTAMKVLAQKFIDEEGFPFSVRLSRREAKKNKVQIIQAYKEGEKTIVPAVWRDDDETDEDYTEYEKLL